VTRGARVLLLGPYVLLLMVFFTAPLVLMLAISFSRQSFGQLEWAFTPQHYVHFFTDAYYLTVLADTLWLGVLTAAASLLLGYPLAYHLALTRSRWKPLLIVFILSPLLVGIVIRCYGWMILLADRGLINATLAQHGWITKPLPLMYNKFGVTLALVHVFLPFMVLSLTGVLKRIEPQLIEASQTLGASPSRAFFEVTLPLSLPGILAEGGQLVVLCSGDGRLEEAFRAAAAAHPGQVAVRIGYDEELSRRIYAGSDTFLMPSRYEPCGLGQLIALRYGGAPIVRRTGGLADTVTEFDPARRSGTGFVFDALTPEALLDAVHRAASTFRQPALWKALVRNAMAEDFSWDASAREYVTLYRKALRARSTR